MLELTGRAVLCTDSCCKQSQHHNRQHSLASHGSELLEEGIGDGVNGGEGQCASWWSESMHLLALLGLLQDLMVRAAGELLERLSDAGLGIAPLYDPLVASCCHAN